MIKTGSALSITRQAQLLSVSRSSIYYRPQPESQEELDLLKRLDELRAGPIRLDRISTAISGALRGSVIHGGDCRRSVWTVG